MRKHSKKQKLSIENSNESKETEVLQIIKKFNPDLEDATMIDKCFQKNTFLRNLDLQARTEVIKVLNYCFVPKDTVVFKTGQIGNYFYIIKSGKVKLVIDDQVKKTLKSGESFGEIALLHGALRSGTIITVKDTYLWCLERKKFKQVIDYMNNKNFSENRTFIQSIPMLNNLDSEMITLLTNNLIKEVYDAESKILEIGEPSDCIYIIKEGSVDCCKEGVVIRRLQKGDCFGLSGVLMNTARSMDVVAKTYCVCYSISTSSLENILGYNFKDVLYINYIKMVMRNSQVFCKINVSLIESSFNLFEIEKFEKNKIVFPKGRILNDKIIIIVEGSLVGYTSQKEKVTYEKGSVLFEDKISYYSLEDDDTCDAGSGSFSLDYDLVALPDCLLVSAELDKFTKMLGGSLKEISEKSSLIESLSKVKLFKNFTQSKLNSFVNNVLIENFYPGEIIIKEGEEGSKFYILKSGKVDIFIKNKYLRTLNEYESFGERALFIKEPRSATAIAKENTSLYVFSKEIFFNIENNLREYIMNQIVLQDNTVLLEDLDYVNSLGKGNFGNVYLVSCKKNKSLYALKSINKCQIDSEQLHLNLEMERQILLQIDHPFIMKLVKCLKDEENIYFLTEYIRGKELWEVIREIGLLNKSQTLFYACSLMIAVDYLHKRKFIHRDIKPENIIVTFQVFFLTLGLHQTNRLRYGERNY
jgi:cGMP-dependent protein kinase